MAGDEGFEAWSRHRDSIAGSLTPERLELLDLLYGLDPVGKQRRCEVEAEAMPTMAWSGDLLFANRLAYQAKSGAISPATWARGYDALVGEAERSGMTWTMVASLLYERGELPGMSTRGSRTYERVTRLVVEHLRALERFQKTAPDKYGPSGQLSVALQPAARADPAIMQVLQRLVEDNVKYKLAPARNAEDLLETSVILGFMGAMLPDPIRGAYLISLRKGLGDKLQVGFDEDGGWDVAALYALHAAGGYLLGDTPDLGFAGDHITRALESDADIEVRPLALIAGRGVHYGTLIAKNQLEPAKVGRDKVGTPRREARDRLEASLRAMADDPEAVPRLPLGRLTTLIDGLIATTALLVDKAPAAEPADECSAQPSARFVPEVRRNVRVLETVRDRLQRDRVLRAGKTTWARRAGLLTVVASDIVDMLAAPRSGAPSFTIASADARRMVQHALEEWTAPEAAAGVAALHALMRDVAAHGGDWQGLVDERREDLGKVLVGTAELVGATEGSGLAKFVVREGARIVSAPDAESVTAAAPKILDVARTLFAAGKADQATVALLVTGALGGEDTELMAEAEKVAKDRDSRAAWYLSTRRAIRGTRADAPLDATLLERGLQAMTDDACKVAQVQPLARVGHAVERFARGERKAATDRLDGFLREVERDGLVVPRVQYQLDEVLESGRLFRMTLYMTAGQGFISENSFNVGFDIYSTRPTSGLTVEIPAAVPEDAGRYYAHVASLNSIYHLLEGRDGPAARDAERALNALAQGVKLGDGVVQVSDLTMWRDDLNPTARIAAELAARRGHVLLAGSLWQLQYNGRKRRAKGEPFDPPEAGWDTKDAPVGLQAVADIASLKPAVLESRTLIERAATCDPDQRPDAPTGLDTCAAYRHAIAMWYAGVYDDPPSMRAGAKEACVREASLVDVLQALRDPATTPLPPRVEDKIARVVEATAKRGYLYDALAMLRAVREKQLCMPSLVKAARQIGRRPNMTPYGQVDWVGYALTCPGRQADETVWSDLDLLAEASQRMANPEVTYRIHTAVVRYMANLRAWHRLAEFSRDRGFVQLMNQSGPGGAATALLIQHASDILSGGKPNLAETQDAYDVACIRYGNTGREKICRELGTFRNRVTREADTDLRPGAEQLVRQLVGL